VLDATYQPELLTLYNEKLKLLADTTIDCCFPIDFTAQLSQLSAYDFMRNVLKERFNVHGLIIGYDTRFGHNRSETFQNYQVYGKELGIEIMQAKPYLSGDTAISSSAIRQLLHVGNVALAADYLSYAYFINGCVVGGHRVGREIGFPTANIRPDASKLIPKDGVYAVRVRLKDDALYDGMLYIGRRPTVHNGEERTIEVNIFDFDKDIYDKPVQVSFIDFIREDITFDSLEDLTAQLAKDKKTVAEVLRLHVE
jgi:riboflavin kinase/FMN adenylyltransferase